MNHAHIRIREKNQITLPASIVREAGLQPNDTVNVEYRNGVISLVPQGKARKRGTIDDYVGAAKNCWGATAEEVNAHFREERDAWGE